MTTNQKHPSQWTITPEDFMTRDERKRLLKVCRERSELDQLHGRRTWIVRYMLVDLALYSGLRVAEMAALKVGDISLNGESYIIVRNGKRDKKRTVWIDRELVKHLKQFLQLKKKTFSESTEPDAPLFTGNSNGHVPPITLQKSFKRAAKEAGLPIRYSVHTARHTYATFLLNDTRNLRYVQKQLGHSSISMTAVYADILPEENGTLANKISRD